MFLPSINCFSLIFITLSFLFSNEVTFILDLYYFDKKNLVVDCEHITNPGQPYRSHMTFSKSFEPLFSELRSS